MKVKVSSSAMTALCRAQSYREFARTWIEERAKSGRFGFSDIARNGGFKSRAFPRDVLLGKKRITLRSLDKFSRGLGLPGELNEYFRILVLIDEPDCRLLKEDLLKLRKLQASHLRRLKSRAGMDLNVGQDQIFEEDLIRVHAALGTLENGATSKEILARTQIAMLKLAPSLQKLIELGFAQKKASRYYPTESLLMLESQQNSRLFQKRYERMCLRAAAESNSVAKSDEKLFLTSAFSVREVDLPRFKEELRNVLVRFITDAERPDGNRVIELVTALF